MCLAFFLETKARSWGTIKETSLDWLLQGLLFGLLKWTLNGRLLGIVTVGDGCLESSLWAVEWPEIVTMCLGSWIPHQKKKIKQPE